MKFYYMLRQNTNGASVGVSFGHEADLSDFYYICIAVGIVYIDLIAARKIASSFGFGGKVLVGNMPDRD